MSKKGKITGPIKRTFEFLGPMKISIHSAYTSFFLVLSVFPTLVVLFSILAYLPIGYDEVMHLVSKLVPEAIVPIAEKIVIGAYENNSGAILSVSAVTAMWSAGRGVRGLLMGLNSVYGLKEDRSYLKTRGISMLYTFLFVIVLVLTLGLLVFGHAIMDYLRMTTNPLLLFFTEVIDWSFLVMMVLQTVLFATMYAYLPNRKQSILKSIPGALLASLGWMVCTNLISIYVKYYQYYANIYGSVYAVALAMLWLYCCISIIFYGAAVNRALMERK